MPVFFRDRQRQLREQRRAQLELDLPRRLALVSEVEALARTADLVRGLDCGSTIAEIDMDGRAVWTTGELIRMAVQLRAWIRDRCPGSFVDARMAA